MSVRVSCRCRAMNALGQPGGAGENGEISPLSDPWGHFRFDLLSAATFHCQNLMKINNLQAMESPCLLCKGQF